MRPLLITGFPRSGTSLLCRMISDTPNCFAFNECSPIGPELLGWLPKMHRKLVNHQPVPNKWKDDGTLVTDTLRQKDEYRSDDPSRVNPYILTRVAPGDYDDDALVAVKYTRPFLHILSDLVGYGWPVVVLVRDPVYTVASWTDAPRLNFTDFHEWTVSWRPDPQSWVYGDYAFIGETPLERRCECWNVLAGKIVRHLDKIANVITYEQLVDRPAATLNWLGIPYDDQAMPLKSRNLPERFKHLAVAVDNVRGEAVSLDEIRDGVEKFCPLRKEFGYP